MKQKQIRKAKKHILQVVYLDCRCGRLGVVAFSAFPTIIDWIDKTDQS